MYQRSDGWPREVLHVAKPKTIRKWELNTGITLSQNIRFLCGPMSSIGLCGMMPSGSAIFHRKMVGKVNEGTCVC